jgi:hypothetical protein
MQFIVLVILWGNDGTVTLFGIDLPENLTGFLQFLGLAH